MATKKKAGSKNRLSELHAMFTELLIKEIEQTANGELMLGAADKAVIAKFLKDNSITADVDDDRMAALRDEFEEELEAKRIARKTELLAKLDAPDSENSLDALLG